MSTKSITTDLNINKSIVKFCNSFNNNLQETLLYIEENFLNNMQEDYYNKIGHNKSLFDIVNQIKTKLQNINSIHEYLNHNEDTNDIKKKYSVWKTSLNRHVNYENESNLLLNVSNDMENIFLVFRVYFHYLGSIWINSSCYEYTDDYLIIEKNEQKIKQDEPKRGIINFMTLRKKTYILTSLKFLYYFLNEIEIQIIRIESEVTKKNEFLNTLRNKILSFRFYINNIVKVLNISIDELDLILSDDITSDLLLYPEISDRFRSYMFTLSSLFEDVQNEFNSIFSLL